MKVTKAKFKFHGGVHPPYNKELARDKAVESLPMPKELVVSMSQHLGAPAKCIVAVGDHVEKGQLVGERNGFISVAVRAPASGTVKALEKRQGAAGGMADAIITGGAEAAIHPLAIGGFANSRALTHAETLEDACTPFDARRSGFTMADGAGVLILEEYEHALQRGATIYAEVAGYGNTCDAHHYTAPRPDGIPASKAIRMALNEARYTSEDVLYINAHGTSTPLNDKTETYAIKLALGEEDARKALISSTKSMTGHMLGAAGAIEIIASALAVKNGIVPPTINYKEPDPECDLNYVPNKAVKVELTMAASNSLGFGGHNACVVLKKIN